MKLLYGDIPQKKAKVTNPVLPVCTRNSSICERKV